MFLCVFVKKVDQYVCGNIHVTYKSIVQFFKFVNSDILHGMWENQTIRKFLRFISIAGRKWVHKAGN